MIYQEQRRWLPARQELSSRITRMKLVSIYSVITFFEICNYITYLKPENTSLERGERSTKGVIVGGDPC